jgi:hypothetical protein
MTTITLGGNTFDLVALRPSSGPSDIAFSMFDAVAAPESPFWPSGVQTQTWLGGDRLSP